MSYLHTPPAAELCHLTSDFRSDTLNRRRATNHRRDEDGANFIGLHACQQTCVCCCQDESDHGGFFALDRITAGDPPLFQCACTDKRQACLMGIGVCLQMSDTAYPSLPTSTARPGQSIAGGVMRTHPPANKPSQHPPPGAQPPNADCKALTAPCSAPHAPAAVSADVMTGMSPSPRCQSSCRTESLHLAPSMSTASHMHASWLIPCCCLHAGPVSGGTPHVRHQAPASPAHAQARSPMQPANAARHQNGRHVSRPSHQPPPVGQQVPAQQQEQAPRQQPSSHVVPPQLVNQQPRQALSQQPPASRVGPPSRQPARKLYSPQVQAPAGGTPHQHAPEVDWESPPEQHHQQPARKLDSPQVPAHVGSMPHQHAQEVDWEAPPEPHQHTPDLEWEPVRPMQVPAHAGSMPYQHTPDTDWEAPPEESHRQRVRPTHSTQVQPHAPGLPASTGVVPPRRLNGQPVKMPARQQPNALHEQNSIPAQQFQGETVVLMLHVAKRSPEGLGICHHASVQGLRNDVTPKIAILLCRIRSSPGSQGFACSCEAGTPCAQGLPPHGPTLSSQHTSAVACNTEQACHHPARHSAAPDAQVSGVSAQQIAQRHPNKRHII